MPKAMDIVASPENNPLLEQLAGKGKGRVFELSIDEIKLGRGDDCDIVINDESVSRHHATIEKLADGTFSISDNHSKNGVLINKNRIDSSPISHGDMIQMGHFVFRFRIPGASSPNIKPISNWNEPKNEVGLKLGNPENKRRVMVWGGLILFVGVMLWLNNSTPTTPADSKTDETKKSEDFKPSDVPETPKESDNTNISALEDPITKIGKEISELENKEPSVTESEKYFKKGQRDYFNKDYSHAIDNFDSAVSLWKRHPLASYYRGLALHESEVEANKNFEIGMKYFNSLQYSRATYHFRQTVDYLSHSDKLDNGVKRLVEQSERYIDFATRKLKAMELAP